MTQKLTDRYRRWFEYERESHARVLASLEAVPESARSNPAFAKAVTLLAHLAAARELWLFRLDVLAQGPTDIFPADMTLSDLAHRLETVHTAWTGFLGSLDDEDLARPFEYETLDGEPFRSTVEDVLTQLFGHSLYHRGQIALLVRTIGAEPAVTDFIYWSREALTHPPAGTRGK